MVSVDSSLKSLLGKEILFLDGGTGSVLQSRGLLPGELPERWNVSHPEEIQNLHYRYFSSGSNIVATNTFGAYISKFDHSELSEIITAAIANAKAARNQFHEDASGGEDHPCFIAYDCGPCGKLLKPMGDLDFEDAVTLFRTSLDIALTQDIDAILIETMNDAYETKAAVIAAKEAREAAGKESLPILVTNVYDNQSRLLTGATPEVMVTILEGLGVDAIGLNCGFGPDDLVDAVRRLVAASSLPVIVKPNAGLPQMQDGKTVYLVGPADFARSMKQFAEEGAFIFGGCCGTTPGHIKALSQELSGVAPKPLVQKNATRIASFLKTEELRHGKKTVLIGERINPTGKKKFKEALKNGDMAYIMKQGLDQVDAGATVLDVNVGLPEIDEKEMMVRVMTELQAITDVPLQIDTSSPEVMEAALRRYNGKALVNSVNGKQEVMDAVFSLVKKYGGTVVALTLDEDGIPATAGGRIAIAEKIVKRASEYGIQKKDIVVDALTMAVSSDSNAAGATLETVRILRDTYGLNSVLGVSNISFGLPNREAVTSHFFALAMESGLTAAIINPLQTEIQKSYHAFNLLHGYDKDCLEYIEFMQTLPAPAAVASSVPAAPAVEPVEAPAGTTTSPLTTAVVKGLKTEAATLTTQLLETTDSVTLINEHLIPGLDIVGKGFEKKTMFLPQLLMAAEAAKASFEVIKARLEATGTKGESKGTVVLATVHGDIHDIGKNIVKVLLENYDFTVIDLGKDVPARTIVDAVKANNIMLVGLSALMTTTVPAMKETIELLHEECPGVKTVVGGAVLTQEYADMIHADFYAKDALDTVHVAQGIFK
ncbi:MAG: homocysteine S-methyltransferase family protein [Treponemataceae bacterium]|nr:homocysteine S-methyltransferase family protein [Treponemataceae bacterium]